MAVVSRLQLNHPALGTAGGAGLHASVESLYTKIGDNMADRWFTIADFDQTETVDLEHNFETDIGNLRYDLYNYTGGEWVRLTADTSPARSAFSIIEKVGFEDTTLQITNNTGGNDLTFAVVLTFDSISLVDNDVKDVDIVTTAPEDGQALVYQLSGKKFVPGASGDSSFKLQSVTDPNATIKGGFLILDDGRELATFVAGYGDDLTVNLDTILGGNPADATAYYLYIDKNLLGAQQTEAATGRKLYKVEVGQLYLSTVSPENIDLARYYPIGLVRSATTGTVWSGTGSQFKNLAVRRHQVPSVNVSPLKETVTRTVETVGASATQLQGGHVLDVNSFPSGIAVGNTSIWNLVNASGADAYGGRSLTANGTPTGATSILAVANGATALNGSTQYFNSTDAVFDPSGNFTVGGWFYRSSWAAPGGVQTLISQGDSNTDRAWRLRFMTSGNIALTLAVTGSTDSDDINYLATGLSAGWHHFAIRYTTATTRWELFVDGVMVGSFTRTIRQASGTNRFQIGAGYGAASAEAFWTGNIDEACFTTLALSDDDIRKLAASKITWTNTLSAANQRLEAEYTYGDFKSQIDSDFIVDKDDDKLYADFSGLPSTAQVSIKMYDAGLSASVIPIRSYDATFTATPGATIAHGLPSMPTSFAVLHDENADGKYVPLDASNHIKADATNIYTAGFGSLTIDGTHPLRIVAAIGQTSATWAKDFSDNLTPQFKTKTTTYTAVKGDKIFADTSGGAFTITLPASAAYGDVIEFFDPSATWDTANVTVARNGHNINGAASDLTLNTEKGNTKLIYFGVTRGWTEYKLV